MENIEKTYFYSPKLKLRQNDIKYLRIYLKTENKIEKILKLTSFYPNEKKE